MMKKGSLAKNTVMLYLLTGSNYLFGLVAIPYLTRVLGAETYGVIGFATAFSVYIQLVLDFGFILSATSKVASVQENREKLASILTAVTLCKLFLIVICAIAVGAICCCIDIFQADPVLYLLYLAYISVNALIPDFLYRGLEMMSIVTIRTVFIRGFFLLGIVLFVKSSADYLLVPVFYLLGASFAAVAVYRHVKKSVGVWFCKVSLSEVFVTMKESAFFFLSRIASTFYGSLNTIILGVVLPGSAVLGQFTACNNIVSAGRAAASPIADSLFPYMVRKKDNRLLVKISIVAECVVIPVCFVVGIFAYDFCGLLFGDEYYEAGGMMRILLFLIPIAFATYLYGFPALTPLGKSNIANMSVVIGAFTQCILLASIVVFNYFSVEAICIATVITESVVLAIRVVTYIKYARLSQ